tara:strand:+ start:2801 stop:3232 length:432 start_codon:yes stop_codon:yes gene_type:complete
MKIINVDDIEHIEFKGTTPAKMYFFNATPKVTKRFLGFLWTITTRPAMKAGWGQDWDPYYCYGEMYSGWDVPDRYSEDEIEENEKFVIFKHPRAGRELMKRASVYIQKRKSWNTAYFDTNEEAETFIKEIEEKSTNKWQLIKN